jgi:pimeloyl-ACP methyl ester carboxylesterase
VVDWPGHGRAGRPPDFARMSGIHVVEAVRALLERIGPAVLLTHSMSGAFGWKLAEDAHGHVLAIVGVAPSPPGNIQPVWSWPAYPEEQPILVTRDEVRHFVGSPRFPDEAFDKYFQTLVPESARLYNERLNVLGTQLRLNNVDVLRTTPILVVSADADPNHPDGVDHRIAEFLGAEHLVLSQHGLHGHGHLMMIEQGNLAVAELILGWLERCLKRC